MAERNLNEQRAQKRRIVHDNDAKGTEKQPATTISDPAASCNRKQANVVLRAASNTNGSNDLDGPRKDLTKLTKLISSSTDEYRGSRGMSPSLSNTDETKDLDGPLEVTELVSLSNHFSSKSGSCSSYGVPKRSPQKKKNRTAKHKQRCGE